MNFLLAFTVILGATVHGSREHPSDQCDLGDTDSCSVLEVKDNNCDCLPNRKGRIKFTRGKIFVCVGDEWKALQYQIPVGTRGNPGYSCEDIKNSRTSAKDGVYWITLDDERKKFPVYCDMSNGGWTLVYKAVTGADGNAFDIYNSAFAYNELHMDALDNTNKDRHFYKNRIVTRWAEFGASEARVVLFKNGLEEKELKFNAQNSDKLNWFRLENLIHSPWPDVLSSKERNSFSIQGLSDRYFFINRNYGGCHADAGWLVITNEHCDWEKKYKLKNTILYSKLSGFTNWNIDSDVGVADVLAVYLL